MTSADFLLRSLGSLSRQIAVENSPDRSIVLLCATARLIARLLVHKSFAAVFPLTLISHATYVVLGHRVVDLLPTSFPHPVALANLSFTSFNAVRSRDESRSNTTSTLGACIFPGPTEGFWVPFSVQRSKQLVRGKPRAGSSPTPKHRAPPANNVKFTFHW